MEEPIFLELWALSLRGLRPVALAMTAPIFSDKVVPMRVRLALGALLGIAIGPEPPPVLADEGLLVLAPFVVQELLIGAALGFALRMFFAAVELAGEVASLQGGLGAASVIDPSSGVSSTALSSLLRWTTLLVFMALEGHHEVLRALELSYERVPMGAGALGSDTLLFVVRLASGIFESAFVLAAPITVAMLVSNLAVGILGRTIPQLNLILLQLPAHIAFTFGILLMGAGAWVSAAGSHLEGWIEAVVAGVLETR
ncbi:MAG: flagellar biosynthetic protein FliR [Myxococcota bacterium]|nr:flagellar biosynthetic protein FliR [Myxococcota bacterium]